MKTHEFSHNPQQTLPELLTVHQAGLRKLVGEHAGEAEHIVKVQRSAFKAVEAMPGITGPDVHLPAATEEAQTAFGQTNEGVRELFGSFAEKARAALSEKDRAVLDRGDLSAAFTQNGFNPAARREEATRFFSKDKDTQAAVGVILNGMALERAAGIIENDEPGRRVAAVEETLELVSGDGDRAAVKAALDSPVLARALKGPFNPVEYGEAMMLVSGEAEREALKIALDGKARVTALEAARSQDPEAQELAKYIAERAFSRAAGKVLAAEVRAAIEAGQQQAGRPYRGRHVARTGLKELV